jgi:large subunit ribosomal protein L29
MKQEVITEMGTVELTERLDEEKKRLTRLRLNHAVSPLDNPNQIGANRKVVARIETELRKRQIEENNTKNA